MDAGQFWGQGAGAGTAMRFGSGGKRRDIAKALVDWRPLGVRGVGDSGSCLLLTPGPV